jgi:hypothetical protein
MRVRRAAVLGGGDRMSRDRAVRDLDRRARRDHRVGIAAHERRQHARRNATTRDKRAGVLRPDGDRDAVVGDCRDERRDQRRVHELVGADHE